MRTLNIYCPRSNGLDRFKILAYARAFNCNLLPRCHVRILPTSKPNSRLLCHEPKTNIRYNLGYIIHPTDKDGLNNDAPVAWDGTGLTSDQFGPDGF